MVEGPEAARALLAKRGRSFAWAARFLGPEAGSRAAELYAFCRGIDDIADSSESPETARSELAALREDLKEGHGDHPLASQFLGLEKKTGLSREAATALIDESMIDTGPRVIAETRGLLRFCYGVAGTVGLMMADVLKAEPRALARPFAIDLGIAMQLTNIARDVGEDARMGRVYVPRHWIGAPWEGTAAWMLNNPDAAYAGACQILNLAERYYHSGLSGLGFLPWRARLGIAIAAKVYRGIGAQVHRLGPRFLETRAVTSSLTKAGLSLAGGAAMLSQLRAGVHDPALHEGLEDLPGTHVADGAAKEV